MWGIFAEGCSGARIVVETDFLCVGFGGGVWFCTNRSGNSESAAIVVLSGVLG